MFPNFFAKQNNSRIMDINYTTLSYCKLMRLIEIVSNTFQNHGFHHGATGGFCVLKGFIYFS